MKLLELTLDTPEANLALDEALLETADEAHEPREVFRIWESPQPLVVLGRASRVAEEVDQAHCRTQGIPILRRCSGGASVVVGPGCLMYAMVLSYRLRPELQQISAAHCFALKMLGDRLRRAVPQIQCQGTSDLTLRRQEVLREQPAGPANAPLISRNHPVRFSRGVGFGLPAVSASPTGISAGPSA